jgi:ferredoxin
MHELYAHLRRYTGLDWQQTVDTLTAAIHPVDRHATRIWFAFFPLDLHSAFEDAADPADLERQLKLMGNWRLADQVDRSHRFLFAHRYWPHVKQAISTTSDLTDPLPALVTAVADAATRRARVDRDMLLGMSAIGLMTLRQAGVDAFAAAPGTIHLSDQARAVSAYQMMKRRARDDSQGLFGFLRGLKKRWTVTFDEADPAAKFSVIHGQEIATAAQADKREYRSRDSRCIPNEGPIPVECRAASCGTCWVGVLGGAEKLSPVAPRDEGQRLEVFGYGETEGATPLVRLACQAKAFGSVSIVIPPWNGFIGKLKT